MTTRYGHAMLVDPTDFIGQKIIRYGVYDKPTLDLIEEVLRLQQPRTILDVGANIGNHALALNSLCKRLLAFEPGQRAWSMLEENVRCNLPNNIEAFNYGLSDMAAHQTLYVNAEGNLGGSSLQMEGDRSWLVDPARFNALFPGYVAYALIWNSNKAYWDARQFGTVRRYLAKLLARKKRVLTAFDPVKHQERVSDLLLVPQEKTGLVARLMYR